VIASSDEDIKCGVTRDAAEQLLGVLYFMREAAGLMNTFLCLVICGICDYADAHKNKAWLKFTASAAAPCAKALLEMMPPQEVQDMATIEKVLLIQIEAFKHTQFTMLVHTMVTVLHDSDAVAREGMASLEAISFVRDGEKLTTCKEVSPGDSTLDLLQRLRYTATGSDQLTSTRHCRMVLRNLRIQDVA
jgi:hypothetical protein